MGKLRYILKLYTDTIQLKINCVSSLRQEKVPVKGFFLTICSITTISWFSCFHSHVLRTCNTCQLIAPQRFVHIDYENEITINCISSPFKVDFKLNDGKQSRTMFRFQVRFRSVWMRCNVGRCVFRRSVGAAVSLTLINPRWRIYDVSVQRARKPSSNNNTPSPWRLINLSTEVKHGCKIWLATISPWLLPCWGQ